MEVKKNPRVNLERWRNVFTQIGLTVVLGILLVAFNWSSKEKSVGDLGQIIVISMEDQIDITRPEDKPEPPPPPPSQEVIEELTIVDNKQEVATIEIDTEATKQTMIAQTDIKLHEEEIEDEPTVFIVVEEAPEFPGGLQALGKFISQSIKYPQIAKENGIQGKVHINFIVDDKGNITKIKVIRGVDPTLDAEAVRVVQNMPKWKPGIQQGKPVYVSFNLPISFVLH